MLPFARLTVPLLFVMLAANASGADFDAASYHAAQCTSCHDSGVYTRENRRVRSYPMLETQVARCDANLATKLFPDDLALLVEHLNSQYYKFAK